MCEEGRCVSQMQALAEEKEAAAAAREMETVRLRAQQEHAADQRSAIDELRARRCAPHEFKLVVVSE